MVDRFGLAGGAARDTMLTTGCGAWLWRWILAPGTTIALGVLVASCGQEAVQDPEADAGGVAIDAPVGVAVAESCVSEGLLAFIRSEYGADARLRSGAEGTVLQFRRWEAQRLGVPDLEVFEGSRPDGVTGPLVNRDDPTEMLSLCYFDQVIIPKAAPPIKQEGAVASEFTAAGFVVDDEGQVFLYSAGPAELVDISDFPGP